MEAVPGRKYRLFIPRTDDGKEAVVTGGEALIEIADVDGSFLVRNQRRASVESLVRTLLSDDMLGMAREMDCLDTQAFEAGRQYQGNTTPVSRE
jgi:hypothetical protein